MSKISPRVFAFLDMLAWSEIGDKLLNDPRSDNGYKVIVGGTFFTSYADHPRKLVSLPRLGIKSTAAGRYQLLSRYYDAYKRQLKLKDFSPESQDKIAIQQIKERKALQLIEQGRIDEAIFRVNNIWASLPGSPYGQRVNDLKSLLAVYDRALKKHS